MILLYVLEVQYLERFCLKTKSLDYFKHELTSVPSVLQYSKILHLLEHTVLSFRYVHNSLLQRKIDHFYLRKTSLQTETTRMLI